MTRPDPPGAESFLRSDELEGLGLGSTAEGVRLSRYARLYSPDRIFLGPEVRIDDFAILSPGSRGIRLMGYNHIAAGAMLFGDIELGEWSTLSSRVAVYAKSDDFRQDAPTYPHARIEARRINETLVRIGTGVVIGSGSTILPGADVADGVAVGAMSLVTKPLDRAGLYAGIPARWLGTRRAPAPSG